MILAFFLACQEKELSPPPYEPSPNSWQELAELCTQESCSPQLCSDFYQAAQQPLPEEGAALSELCLWLDKEISESAQYCALQACYILPTVAPSLAAGQLLSEHPKSAAQKLARQAIVRGMLSSPKLFSDFVLSDQAQKHSGRWLGVTLAEAECKEASVAVQMQLQCRKRSPILATTLWTLATTLNDPASKLSAQNVALIQDEQTIFPKLFQAFVSESDPKLQASYASSLHFALLRGNKLTEEELSQALTLCSSAPSTLIPLCQQLKKIKPQ